MVQSQVFWKGGGGELEIILLFAKLFYIFEEE